jgi:hypothetical protein
MAGSAALASKTDEKNIATQFRDDVEGFEMRRKKERLGGDKPREDEYRKTAIERDLLIYISLGEI